MKSYLSNSPLDILKDKDIEKLRLLEECSDLDFVKAVGILELDPKRDFRFVDLTNVDLSGVRTDDFDFAGAITGESTETLFPSMIDWERSIGSRKRLADAAHRDLDRDPSSDSFIDSERRYLEGLRSKVMEGDALAMFELGMEVLRGTAYKPNPREAVSLFERAAKQDLRGGLNTLADCYFMGIGAEVDIEKANELYARAAELGSSYAMMCLSYSLAFGLGMPHRKLREAEDWYRRAKDLQQSQRDIPEFSGQQP